MPARRRSSASSARSRSIVITIASRSRFLWCRTGRRRRGGLDRQLALLQIALAIVVALAVGDPSRRRLALQVVIEPLEDAMVIVDLILALAQPMIFTAVLQHDDVLPRAARDVV